MNRRSQQIRLNLEALEDRSAPARIGAMGMMAQKVHEGSNAMQKVREQGMGGMQPGNGGLANVEYRDWYLSDEYFKLLCGPAVDNDDSEVVFCGPSSPFPTQRCMPAPAALWAKHSEDTVGLQVDLASVDPADENYVVDVLKNTPPLIAGDADGDGRPDALGVWNPWDVNPGSLPPGVGPLS